MGKMKGRIQTVRTKVKGREEHRVGKITGRQEWTGME